MRVFVNVVKELTCVCIQLLKTYLSELQVPSLPLDRCSAVSHLQW